MNAWFDPEVARWFSFLSLLSLLAVTAPLADRGLYKTLVVGAHAAAVVLGLVILGLAVIAVLSQQPAHVVRPLFIAGIVLTLVFAATFPVTLRAYREAEHRRITAKDL